MRLISASANLMSKEKALSREVTITIVIAVVIIGGFLGANIALEVMMGTESPLVVVSSGSMEPALLVGDICLIQYRAPEDIQVGDIIVFHATWLSEGSLPVIHRVRNITILDGIYYFTTQGDNVVSNPLPDPSAAPESNIEGVVIFTLPKIGLVILWLREGYNYQIVALILTTLIILTIFWDYIRPKKEDALPTTSSKTVEEKLEPEE